jgi:hypothetical protein
VFLLQGDNSTLRVDPADAPKGEEVVPGQAVDDASAAVVSAETPAKPLDPPPIEQSEIDRLLAMPEAERLARVEALELSGEGRLPSLLDILQDKRLSPHVRNNLANRLLTLEDSAVCDGFVAGLADPAENPTWREYCLKFLGPCYSITDDPDAILTKVQEIAQGDSPMKPCSCCLRFNPTMAPPPPSSTTL